MRDFWFENCTLIDLWACLKIEKKSIIWLHIKRLCNLISFCQALLLREIPLTTWWLNSWRTPIACTHRSWWFKSGQISANQVLLFLYELLVLSIEMLIALRCRVRRSSKHHRDRRGQFIDFTEHRYRFSSTGKLLRGTWMVPERNHLVRREFRLSIRWNSDSRRILGSNSRQWHR